jgi:predicted nucleotidyltransferase
MEEHLKSRPKKTIFSPLIIQKLKDKAIKKIKSKLLQDSGIIKIVMIGSSLKNSFGKYAAPGFRGSLYSDFDFIVFIRDDYEIPGWLDRELDGKPFPDDEMNLDYRNKKFIDEKYDVEVFFIRERNMKNKKIQKLGEMAGIPMSKDSKHKNLIIYED